MQVKSIQDAIRDKKQRFNFLGEDVNLCPSVGIFITMNPGYAGRTELPENLKALFRYFSVLVIPLWSYQSSIPLSSAIFSLTHRPCAMVVPDFELICEIMLVAEGFMNARVLARKFITLYTLCKELLSKQVRSSSTLPASSKTESSLTLTETLTGCFFLFKIRGFWRRTNFSGSTQKSWLNCQGENVYAYKWEAAGSLDNIPSNFIWIRFFKCCLTCLPVFSLFKMCNKVSQSQWWLIVTAAFPIY